MKIKIIWLQYIKFPTKCSLFRLIFIVFVSWSLNNVTSIQSQQESPKTCISSSNNIALNKAPDLKGYAQAINAYLSNGGLVENLDKFLLDQEMISPVTDESKSNITSWYLNRGGIRQVDINGDDLLDVVVSLGHPPTFSGNLYVYICTGSGYRLLSPLDKLKHDHTGLVNSIDRPPKLIFVGDMTADSKAELVFDIGVSGASSIWMDVKIYGWDNSQQDLTSLYDAEINYPADAGSYKVTEPSKDGYRELIVKTGFAGSGVASGPQRQHLITYSWNGNHFVETSVQSDPPKARIHAAYDAVYALNQARIDDALALYKRVLIDNTLSDWVDTRNTILAHAAYGLVITSAQKYGTLDPITVIAYDGLQQMTLQNELKDNLWFKYAHVFMETAQTKGSLSGACSAVNLAISKDLASLSGPKGIQWLGLWPQFSYNINWIPTERGLSFCPF